MTSSSIRPAPERPQLEVQLVDCAVEGPASVEHRIQTLNQEWSCDRALACGVAVVTLLGVGTAYLWSPWGLLVAALAAIVLLQNSLMRTSVLASLLKRLGWRTAAEREVERSMLKAVRGDFAELPPVVDEADREAIARLEGEGGAVDGPDVPVPVDQEAVREIVERVQRDAPVG